MKTFRRHAAHSYQGHRFPWYLTVAWVILFAFFVIYVVRFLLLSGNAGN